VEPDERTTVCWFGTGTSLYGGAVYSWQSFYWKDDPVEPWKKPRAERLAMAKKLLDEAGWVEGPGGIRVSKGVAGLNDGTPFKFDAKFEANWPASGCHAQLLQKWMKEIGIEANPVAYDPSIFWQDVGAGKMDFFHSGWYSYLSARELYRNNWHSKGYGNQYMVRASVPELDKAIEAAEAETDPAQQAKMYHEIEKVVSDLQLAILVGSQDTLVLTNGRLQGFFPRPDDSNRALIISDIPQ
jgi:peptide/nickel transport system substrate-binding protein